MKNRLIQIFDLAKEDFAAAYAGSGLGALWGAVYPLLTVLLYVLVFRVILDIKAEGDAPYVLWMLSALVPYLFMSEGISAAASVYRDYAHLVRRQPLELCLLPPMRVLSRFFAHMIFLALLILICIFCGFASIRLAALIYFVIAEVIFTLAVGDLLAWLSVFFRDILGALPALVQLGCWITPIFWSLSGFAGANILRTLNPGIYIIEGFRFVFCGGSTVSLGYTVWFWLFCAAIFACSALFFRKAGNRLSDFI